MADSAGNFDRLERALEVFVAWEDAGCRPSPQELLARHPDLGEVLEPLFDEAARENEGPDPDGDHPRDADASDEPHDDRANPADLDQAPAGPDDLPDEIGGFRIEYEIGRGGMGVVYAARQIALDRRVALKVLPADSRVEPRAVARFRRESALLAALDHPSLVEVLTVGREGGHEFFAMELVDGVPLSRILDRLRNEKETEVDGSRFGSTVTDLLKRAKSGRSRTRATSAEPSTTTSSTWHRSYFGTTARLVWQIADALAHAHAAGVLHRDVKSSNILVRRDGRAVLTDFGLAREVGRPSLTRSGEFAGTPYYAAPEQVLGRSRDLDGRADVFSLGVVLYELLTLHRPFAGKNSHEVAEAVLTKEPADPSSVNRRVPRDLAAVALRALEKDPRRRYATATEFAADLEAFVGHRPVRARKAGLLRRLGRYCHREPAKAALAIVLLVSIPAMGFLGGYVHARQPLVEAGEAAEKAAEVDRLLERAFVIMEQRLPHAIEVLAKARRLDPGHPDTLALWLHFVADRRSPTTALQELDAITPTERMPEASLRRMRAHLLHLAGQTEDAATIQASLSEPESDTEAFLAGVIALDRGHRDQQAADYQAAVASFELAVMLSKRKRSLYHLQLAHALGHCKDDGRGQFVADTAVRLWPESSRALYWAHFAVRRSHPDLALERLQRAAALDPQGATIAYSLGSQLLELGRNAEAIEPLRRACRLSPNFDEAHADLARALRATGEMEAALTAMDGAIKVAPQVGMYHSNRGILLAALDRMPEAYDALDRAIELAPEHPIPLKAMVNTLQSDKGHEASRDFCRQRIASGHGIAEAHFFLADALVSLGAPAEAAEVLNEAIRDHPESAILLTRRARLLRRSDPERALADAERATEVAPELAVAWSALGTLRSDLQQFDGAVAAHRRHRELDPSDPRGWLNLAQALRAAEGDEAALTAAHDTVERFPKWLPGRQFLIEGLLRLRGPATALAAAERALEALPGEPQLRNGRITLLWVLARDHRAAGRDEEARQAAQRGLDHLGDRNDLTASSLRERLEALLIR